jgi:hypothetical protein
LRVIRHLKAVARSGPGDPAVEVTFQVLTMAMTPGPMPFKPPRFASGVVRWPECG